MKHLFCHSLSFIRSLVFNLFFFLWTASLSILFLPLFLFDSPIMLTRIVGTIWARGLHIALRLLCGIKVEVRGEEHIPERSVFVLASKHQSAWETYFFFLLFSDAAYVLKEELTRIPFFGQYLIRMGMVSIDRSGKGSSLKELIRKSNNALKQRRPVILFPEGTRMALGSRVAYHPGIAAIYSQCHAPVVPVALNSGFYWGKNAFLKKPGTIVLEFLSPIQPGLKRDSFMHCLEASIEEASDRLAEEAGCR